MSRVLLVLGGVALVSLATSAAAQSIAPLRLGVALGTSFGHNSWVPAGGHAVVSLTSQPVGSRFGIRVEALLEGESRYTHVAWTEGYAWNSETTLGLTVNGIYRLWGPTTGLYVIGGLGLYQRWTEHKPFSENVTRSSSVLGLGVNAGLGFDFKAFGRVLLLESRLHSGAFSGRVPVSLGIRF